MNLRNMHPLPGFIVITAIGYSIYIAFMLLQAIVVIGLIVYFIRSLIYKDEN